MPALQANSPTTFYFPLWWERCTNVCQVIKKQVGANWAVNISFSTLHTACWQLLKMEGSSGPASSAAILSFGYTIIITVCCLLLSVFQQSDQGNTTLIVVPSCLHLMTRDGLHVCRVSTLNWANVPVLFEERNCLINLQSGTCLVVWGCFPNSGAASYQSKTNSGCFYVDRHWLPCTPADPTLLFMCQHGTRSYLCKTNLYKSPIKFRNHAVCNFWGLDHIERYSTHSAASSITQSPGDCPTTALWHFRFGHFMRGSLSLKRLQLHHMARKQFK